MKIYLKSQKRVVVGILKGLDQVVNVVLANTEERVFTPEGVDRQALGLYLIRGDNVAVVGNNINRYLRLIANDLILLGAVDENTELGMDFSTIKAQQLPPIVHD